MHFKIKTGEYQVLESGVFHAISGAETVIEIDDLKLVISFEDVQEGNSKIESSVPDVKTLRLRFINFSKGLDVGNTEPLEIGTFDEPGLVLYMSYRIRSLPNTAIRTFEYTFFSKKNATNE